MAKVVITKSKLDALAQHISAKVGTSGTLTIAQMQAAVDGITGTERLEWHQCPTAPREYLSAITYDPADYSVSHISEYAPTTPVASNYKPIGKTVDGTTYYDLEPLIETPFAGASASGTLKPLDALRWINTQVAPNVRDLGGWACDGGTVRYGLLFRGGYATAADRDVLVGELGVRHEVDLRGSSEEPINTSSPLGADVRYTRADTFAWYTLTDKAAWRVNLRAIFDAVVHGTPVYFHCSAGADRTGTVACVLEGLLGVSQSDIDKDYELTSFYTPRYRNGDSWKQLIGAITALEGSTFRDKCVGFAASLGFTAAEINAFRAAMIDGTPEEVTPAISTYTVAAELTHAASDNAATQAVQYQPYAAKIIPASGYVIGSVQIKMGGVDITNQVWAGADTVLQRAVALDLAHCSISNTRTVVIDGQSYAAEIRAEAGYTLDGAAVSITMGGVDVATYYKDGVIAIPSVSGDLEIAVTAVPSATSVTNLVDTLGVAANTRVSLSTGKNAAAEGHCVVGSDESKYFGLIAGDVIRIKGATVTIPQTSELGCAICYYGDNGEHTTYAGQRLFLGATSPFRVELVGDVYEITCITAEAANFRVAFQCTDTSDLVVTRNQEIS